MERGRLPAYLAAWRRSGDVDRGGGGAGRGTRAAVRAVLAGLSRGREGRSAGRWRGGAGLGGWEREAGHRGGGGLLNGRECQMLRLAQGAGALLAPALLAIANIRIFLARPRIQGHF